MSKQNKYLLFPMLQAKYSPLLLFVAPLLMASCHSTEGTKGGDGNAGICKMETFNFTSNSSRFTHFAYGIAPNVVAVLLYGSAVVPVKKTETGDGMYFQWINCAAIWAVSMVADLWRHSPKFYPLAMLGGVIWATGNLTVVPIVKAIGLSLGLLIWGSSSLLLGWASSRFGWFGITSQEFAMPILNYCGAGLCLLSGLMFFFVKATVELHPNSDPVPLLFDNSLNSGTYGCLPRSSEFWLDDIEPKTRRFIGCLLAVAAGLLYGSSLQPILYIKSHSSCSDSMFYGASVADLDYFFALCCGIFASSTVYFVIYCVAMRNRPRIYAGVILPGILSGLMWGTATYCWFLANNHLSRAVSFPVVTAGYGLVAATWGFLVFREIKGVTNCFIFFLSSCILLSGSLMIAISE